jgi:hypothetical protein
VTITNYEIPYCVIFSILLLLPVKSKYSLLHSVLNHQYLVYLDSVYRRAASNKSVHAYCVYETYQAVIVTSTQLASSFLLPRGIIKQNSFPEATGLEVQSL